MRNFNRDRDGQSSGGWKGGKKRDFGFRDSRDSDGPEMFQTVCSDCGNDCEVPFKPNGRKPVFCRDCFKRNNSEDSFGFDRRDDRRDDRREDRRDRERPSYDKPFKPAPGPVESNKEFNKEQFAMLNVKLDYVLKALSQLSAAKESSCACKAPAMVTPVAKKEAPVVSAEKEEAPKAKKPKKVKKAA
jgi:CxxC-x17-CxxC domain-containing protein